VEAAVFDSGAVASIVASVLRTQLLGAGPLFPASTHGPLSGTALALAASLGIVAGFGSGLLTMLVYACEDFFQRLPLHWMWSAIGAVFIGVGGLVEGYDTIHSLLRGEIIGAVVVGLLVTKGLVWSIALGSGTSGGVLAPLLFMGGELGSFVGVHLPVGDRASGP
jgi:H+/Cl- antiporter ClcA